MKSKEDRIFLGIGGNLGDRHQAIQDARAALASAGWKEITYSGAWETPPWGKTDQPAFLNAVIEGRWEGNPYQLLPALLKIEAELGRERQEKWGPRLIDIDILSYGEEQIHTQRLTLPHPHLHLRAFVLVPWAAIAPNYTVPGLNQSVQELLQALPQEEVEAVQLVDFDPENE